MDECLLVLSPLWKRLGDFLHSCGESKLSEGKPPRVLVGVESEGDGLGFRDISLEDRRG
jgi:hypothetical protein